MTDSDSDTWQREVQAEARAQVLHDRIERRLTTFSTRRPAAFSNEGKLSAEVHQWMEAYLAGASGALILGGPVGTAKTWAAWKVIETLVRGGWDGRYDVVEAYTLKAAASIPVDRDRLDGWARDDLLVLDDVGSIRINDWDADALFSLIDQRWQHQRPTIITSNELNLRILLGDRAASRLADGATAIEFDGDDLRRVR